MKPRGIAVYGAASQQYSLHAYHALYVEGETRAFVELTLKPASVWQDIFEKIAAYRSIPSLVK